MTCIECSVIVKDDNKKLVNKYLKYDPLTLHLGDNEVIRMVSDTLDQFKMDDSQEKPSIIIKTTMVFQ
jgi:FKBP-type peptidyl-prolyl cis-trans isomerase 2